MYLRRLALTATAYVVCHHLGLLPGGLGAAPRDTQWADWLDLLAPFVVLVPAAATLQAAGATTRTWWVFGIGAVTYATGHGVHLAANSPWCWPWPEPSRRSPCSGLWPWADPAGRHTVRAL